MGEKFKLLFPTISIAFSSALVRTLLLPHTRGFVASFLYVIGSTLMGVLVGVISLDVVAPSYLHLIIAVTAAASREFLEFVIKQVKRLNSHSFSSILKK